MTARIDILIDLDKKHHILSEWESGFLRSLHSQSEKGRTLSVKQNGLLQKIEAKLSMDAIDEASKWENEWDAEKQFIARTCATYYLHVGYFQGAAARTLAEPEWIMPRALYTKMCGNKYAKKVIATAMAPPRYEPGTPVMLRATSPRWDTTGPNRILPETPLFVLEVLAEVKSAAKGAKIYRVLPATCSDTIEVEERHLKKFKQPIATRKRC
tara:strand:- start:8344 stop:8979 length:636 start_codon:yes stop_codon:yes gene_type:complete